MIKIQLKLFASLKDICGFSSQDLSYDAPVSVETLLQDLISSHPAMAEKKSSLLVAVNEDYSGPDALLKDGDTVAIFPPVSGG